MQGKLRKSLIFVALTCAIAALDHAAGFKNNQLMPLVDTQMQTRRAILEGGSENVWVISWYNHIILCTFAIERFCKTKESLDFCSPLVVVFVHSSIGQTTLLLP